jgi:hypothetical protein
LENEKGEDEDRMNVPFYHMLIDIPLTRLKPVEGTDERGHFGFETIQRPVTGGFWVSALAEGETEV